MARRPTGPELGFRLAAMGEGDMGYEGSQDGGVVGKEWEKVIRRQVRAYSLDLVWNIPPVQYCRMSSVVCGVWRRLERCMMGGYHCVGGGLSREKE